MIDIKTMNDCVLITGAILIILIAVVLWAVTNIAYMEDLLRRIEEERNRIEERLKIEDDESNT